MDCCVASVLTAKCFWIALAWLSVVPSPATFRRLGSSWKTGSCANEVSLALHLGAVLRLGSAVTRQLTDKEGDADMVMEGRGRQLSNEKWFNFFVHS